MNHWFLLVQLGVGGLGALLFLSALGDAFMHEEHLLAIKIRHREIEQMDADEDEVVLEIDPQPEGNAIPPAS